MIDKRELLGMTIEEIAASIAPLGWAKFRASQIARWLYLYGAGDFAAMTNLSHEQRQLLADHFTISSVTLCDTYQSADRKTVKYLLAFSDGLTVETVGMNHSYGNSVCISTQIGCAMGCTFCASTAHGMARNLTTGELISQVLFFKKHFEQSGQHVNSLVIMGSGEPLLNYDAVLCFLRLCHSEYFLDLSYRSMTISTAGIVPGIYRLADEGLPVTLAVSLHAPDDRLRSALMPINKSYPLEQVLEAADYYAAKTGRRITYEYLLIAGINDEPEHARRLAKLLQGRLAMVNLIPVNAVPGQGLQRPRDEVIAQFCDILDKHHITATVRREMGGDIQAACGQLRNANDKNSVQQRSIID